MGKSKGYQIDVKMAVKEIYGAQVDEVRMAYQRSKKRYMRKGVADKRSEAKKAYVTLKDKAKLDLTKFEKESNKGTKVVKTPKVKATKSSSKTEGEGKTTKSTKK